MHIEAVDLVVNVNPPADARRTARVRRWLALHCPARRPEGGARDRRTGARRDLSMPESLRAHAGGYPDLLGSYSVILAQ